MSKQLRWWLTSRRSHEAIRQAQRAYYVTFYQTAEGRQVLADISRIIRTGTFTPEASVALNDLLMVIRQTAGLTDELAIVENEVRLAASYSPPPAPNTTIEGFTDED